MSKVYAGASGTEIILDCEVDISAATVTKILVRKPSGAMSEWVAQKLDATRMVYVTQDGDLGEVGLWRLQAYVETATWKGRGSTCEMRVFSPYA